MKKAIFGIMILCSALAVCQTDKPQPLTPEKKLALYSQRDKIDPLLGKLQATPLWAEYQKATEEQKKANTAVDAVVTKIKASQEGKDYIKAADDYAISLQAVTRGVDLSKWRLGEGFEWQEIVATPAPKPDTKEKK